MWAAWGRELRGLCADAAQLCVAGIAGTLRRLGARDPLTGPPLGYGAAAGRRWCHPLEREHDAQQVDSRPRDHRCVAMVRGSKRTDFLYVLRCSAYDA